ncbi:hypothetical protein GW17_00022424 [Ensete ventricosum]|nr:hypothetical protein GW17_00022424 [Ensete ventricosum]
MCKVRLRDEWKFVKVIAPAGGLVTGDCPYRRPWPRAIAPVGDRPSRVLMAALVGGLRIGGHPSPISSLPPGLAFRSSVARMRITVLRDSISSHKV